MRMLQAAPPFPYYQHDYAHSGYGMRTGISIYEEAFFPAYIASHKIHGNYSLSSDENSVLSALSEDLLTAVSPFQFHFVVKKTHKRVQVMHESSRGNLSANQIGLWNSFKDKVFNSISISTAKVVTFVIRICSKPFTEDYLPPVPPFLDIIDVTLSANGTSYIFTFQMAEDASQLPSFNKNIQISIALDINLDGIYDAFSFNQPVQQSQIVFNGNPVLAWDGAIVNAQLLQIGTSHMIVDNTNIHVVIPYGILAPGIQFEWAAFSGFNRIGLLRTNVPNMTFCPHVDNAFTSGGRYIFSISTVPSNSQAMEGVMAGKCPPPKTYEPTEDVGGPKAKDENGERTIPVKDWYFGSERYRNMIIRLWGIQDPDKRTDSYFAKKIELLDSNGNVVSVKWIAKCPHASAKNGQKTETKNGRVTKIIHESCKNGCKGPVKTKYYTRFVNGKPETVAIKFELRTKKDGKKVWVEIARDPHGPWDKPEDVPDPNPK
jgi:hypothetical protein